MAAAALSMTLILTGCASNRALFDAAGDLGTLKAGVTLADQPADCAINTPHAALHTGQDKLTALVRERQQVDTANSKRLRCYTFNKVQIDGMRGVP